jgi:cation diffusion facilitator family transporter
VAAGAILGDASRPFLPAVSGLPNLARYAWLSIIVAVVTLGMKLLGWWLTGSVGLLSDALETVVNLVAAFIALVSLNVSAKPADDDHAYGHTKVEYFASGMEGAMVLVAAGGIAWNAILHLLHPHPLEKINVGLWLVGAATVLNFVVARILFSAGRRERSVALEADAHHLMTDVWTTITVIVAVFLVSVTGWNWLDPLTGVLLAFHIMAIGVKLVRQALLGLMDTGFPEEDMKIVRDVLAEHSNEGVQYHALRTRQAGARRFMSVHLLVPGKWTVAEGHEVAERVEADLRAKLPRLHVTTHLEPLEDPVSWEDEGLEREVPAK